LFAGAADEASDNAALPSHTVLPTVACARQFLKRITTSKHNPPHDARSIILLTTPASGLLYIGLRYVHIQYRWPVKCRATLTRATRYCLPDSIVGSIRDSTLSGASELRNREDRGREGRARHCDACIWHPCITNTKDRLFAFQVRTKDRQTNASDDRGRGTHASSDTPTSYSESAAFYRSCYLSFDAVRNNNWIQLLFRTTIQLSFRTASKLK